MLHLNFLALLIAIVCCTQIQYGHGAAHGSRESHHPKRGFILIGKKSFDAGNLVFAVCNRNTTSTTQCTLVQKVYPDKENKHSCIVTLKGEHDESHLSMLIGIYTLGKDKAILYWGEVYKNSSTTKIGTVDFKTCKMTQVTIPDPQLHIFEQLLETDKLVTYDDDSIAVFVNDTERFGDKLGKMEINNDGTAKGELKASDINGGQVYFLSPIATGSSSKGYAALRKEGTDFKLMLIKPDGTEKHLETYQKASTPTYSAGGNLLSVCNKVTDLVCKQYDEDGKVKFTTTLSEKSKNTVPTAMSSLPGGGMLVLVAERKSCEDQSSCNRFQKNYRMVNIAADGKITGTARVDDFNSSSKKYKTTFIYKFADVEYCAALIGENPSFGEREPDDIDIIHQCVTEDGFSHWHEIAD